MPVEETENEIRVRVHNPDDFKRLAQIFPTNEQQTPEDAPYNKMGIRGIGGPLKSNDEIKVQAYRFSKKEQYKWTPAKAEAWVREQGETPKGYSDPIAPVDFTFDFPIAVVKAAFEVPQDERVPEEKDIDVLYIEGPLSTDVIDRTGDVIDQASINFDDFKKNPVLLFHHNPEWPIGKVLKLTKNKDLGNGRRGLWIRAAIIGNTDKAREVLKLVKNRIVRGFSIRGKATAKKRVCLSKGICHNVLLNLNVVEATVTPTPANQDTLFDVAKALIDISSPAIDPSGPGNDTLKEEAHMTETDGTGTGAKDTQLQIPPELLEQLEALNTNLTALADRMTKVETEIATLKKPEEEATEEQPEDTVAADDGKGTTKTDDTKKTDTTVVEVNGVKKSLNSSVGGTAGSTAAGIDVVKASDDAKRLAEVIWRSEHPK